MLKEEKRKSVIKGLCQGKLNQHQSKIFNQRKQTITTQQKFKLFQQSTHQGSKFVRVVKRIGTKPIITSFHAHVDDPHSTSANLENSRIKELTNRTKTDKQSFQLKQFRKKLKRVGKKVWVTAFKQSIDEDQSIQNENKGQTKQKQKPDNDLGQGQFSQFQQQINSPFQNFIVKNQQKGSERNYNFKTQRENWGTEKPKEAKQENRRASTDMSQDKQKPKREQQQLSQARNLQVQSQKDEKLPIIQLTQQPQIEVDIDKMLQEIQNQHQSNKIPQKLGPKNSQIFSKASTVNINGKRLSRPNRSSRPSRLSKQSKQNLKSGDQSQKTKILRQNSILLSKQEPNLVNRQPVLQEPTLKQSVSLYNNNEKSPKPFINFSYEKKGTMLSSDFQPRTPQLLKQGLSPAVRKQQSINSVHSMTNSKVQLNRPNLKQIKGQLAKGNHVSMHSSVKKQTGARKLGIQKFKNSEPGEENRITSSLKKNNKNLSMNWYIAQARKQITVGNPRN